eukprot:2031047-Rhodomonas_salina.2
MSHSPPVGLSLLSNLAFVDLWRLIKAPHELNQHQLRVRALAMLPNGGLQVNFDPPASLSQLICQCPDDGIVCRHASRLVLFTARLKVGVGLFHLATLQASLLDCSVCVPVHHLEDRKGIADHLEEVASGLEAQG